MGIATISIRFVAAVLAAGWTCAPARAATYTLLHAFKGDEGALSVGAMTYAKDHLYGTTTAGGAGYGTVFRLDLATGVVKAVHVFLGGSDGAFPYGDLKKIGGTLYGTLGNAIFSVDVKTGAEQIVYQFPEVNSMDVVPVGLSAVGGLLFGATTYGGSLPACTSGVNQVGCGAVFLFDPALEQLRTMYAFRGGHDGAYPSSPLLSVGTAMYGTTGAGGLGMCGTVYRFNPESGAETVIYSFPAFACPDAEGDLLAVDGVIYGTTRYGGAAVGGTVYALDTASNAVTTLYVSDGKQVTFLNGGLLYDNGLLWGTASRGGKHGKGCNNGCGVVFTLNPANGKVVVVHAFQGASDGALPQAGLTEVNGTFYGTTSYGGAHGGGTIFAITP